MRKENSTNCNQKKTKHHLTIIMGDLNAKVGKDNKYVEQSMGKQGLGERNENGQKLVNICSENDMAMTGTISQHKNIHKSTWTSPDNKTNNQINHILINNKYRTSVLDTRSKRGTDISRDHQLVSKIKLKLKTNISKSIKRIQFDVQKLKQTKWQEEFEKELHNKSRKIENSNNKETIEELWENFKTAYIETTQNKGGDNRRYNPEYQ